MSIFYVKCHMTRNTYAHTMHTNMCTNACTYVHWHQCILMHTHAHTHTHTHSHTHSHTHTHTHTHTNTHTHTHSLTHSHTHTHTHIHSHIHTQTHTHTHTLTPTNTPTNTHTHTRTHARTRTHTCIHTRNASQPLRVGMCSPTSETLLRNMITRMKYSKTLCSVTRWVCTRIVCQFTPQEEVSMLSIQGAHLQRQVPTMSSSIPSQPHTFLHNYS